MHLYTPFFTPDDAPRRQELELCLHRNATSSLFSTITLMVDDDCPAPDYGERVRTLRLPARPTYADWVALSYDLAFGEISVLANADIFFDESLTRLEEIFIKDPRGFVALSRHEWNDGTPALHPNPQWSQDVWAFLPSHNPNPIRDEQLRFPLGVPRCDNRAAYVFAIHGHEIYNPCHTVRAFHVHASGIRSYEKTLDRRIVGGMGMVGPSNNLLEPSKVDIEVWPVRARSINSVKVNRSLSDWLEKAAASGDLDLGAMQGDLAATRRPFGSSSNSRGPSLRRSSSDLIVSDGFVLAYNQDWQTPAITEKHAFAQIQAAEHNWRNAVYVAYPWATLIDLLRKNPSAGQRLTRMREGLSDIRELAPAAARVVTVCQHVRLAEYTSLLLDAGVTDVFWSHATKADRNLCEGRIRVHPFPLYPVQTVESPTPFGDRKLLFSFVGARPTKDYISQSRQHIFDRLSGNAGGVVLGREHWHYKQTVYDHQILEKSKASRTLNTKEEVEYVEVLSQSKFALCPDGSGPNSIRLWEAIASDTIPVIIADTLNLPGPGLLWEAAAVFCDAKAEAIAALPDRLGALATDRAEIERKMLALKALRMRYGRGGFAPDVLRFLRGEKEVDGEVRPARANVIHMGTWTGHSVSVAGDGLEIDRGGRDYDGQAIATLLLPAGLYHFEIDIAAISHRLEIRISDQAVAAADRPGRLAFEYRSWADRLVINLHAAGSSEARVAISRIEAVSLPLA